jgi:drug/metabolite transporter (DMT)-like permease
MAETGQGGQRMPLTQWLLLLLLAGMWGIAYTLVGFALRELPPLTLVFSRLVIAAAILAVVVRAMGLAWPRGLAGWLPFMVMAVFNNVIPFSLIARGQQDIASGLASVIVATTPLWTLLVGHGLRVGERIAGRQVLGILVGIVGVAVLFGPELAGGGSGLLFGMTLVLAGAASYGCAGVWGARFRGVPPLLSSCCQLVCSSFIMLVLCSVIEEPWRLAMPGPATIGAVLTLAVVSTALAYIVFYRVLAASGGVNVMLVTLIMPPLSILFGIVALDEVFEPRYAAGAAVIAVGLAVIDGRLPGALLYSWRNRTGAPR